MNDFDPALDELVSAYVDDAATPAERARVESDPSLVERAATFRRMHDALATPPAPATEDARRALIDRALADSAAPVAAVHPLRRRRLTAVGPLAAAAAIIALFFGLGTWLVASQDNNDSSSSTAAGAPQASDSFSSKDALGQSAATVAGATAAGGNAPAATVPTAEAAKAPPVYLGRFEDEAGLRKALLAPLASTPTAGSLPSADTRAVTTTSCPRSDLAAAATYTADLVGRPVTIVVSGTRADVIDDATCARTTLDLTSR